MRLLKFRVWDGKVMTYPKVVEIGINGVNGLPSASYQLDSGGYCTSAHVMQYTGLKDKNGQEIYEGDILRDIYEIKGKPFIDIGRIEIINGCACLKYKPDEDGEHYCPVYGGLGHYEVTGNIYENPELEVR